MEFLPALNRIAGWLDGSEDEEYDIRKEVIPVVFVVHDYDKQGDRKVRTFDAQSHRFQSKAVPHVFYRASFLFGHLAAVDYKGPCICITSPDQHFVASLEFFKYELGLYLSVSKEHHRATERSGGVIAGAPGADNGWSSDEASERWFKTLIRLMERRWLVYSGNNFEV